MMKEESKGQKNDGALNQEKKQVMQVLGEPIPRKEILLTLQENSSLYKNFCLLTEKLQEQFLDFCCGVSGLKMCYDPFFKYILDPEVHPERLSDLLSAILMRRITVRKVLPTESGRILADGSLLIMDIIVELEDGSLGNVEIQKLSYAFPGARGACYSSDMVLRQYSKVRRSKKKKFSYKDLKPVYTIVIMENSTAEFRKFPEQYIHRARQTFDTGLEMDLLQEYIFIPLDVFRNIIHNNGIRNELEAWLAFLAFDDPETIWTIRNAYPQFDDMYQDMADFRKNIGEVLHMFSKQLEIMDRNDVEYMIDELQAEVEKQKKEKEQLRIEAEVEKKRLEAENRKLMEELEKIRKNSQS